MVDDHAAAQRFPRRGAAQDISVAANGNKRIAQFELDPAFFAWMKFFGAEQAQGGDGLTCPNKELYFAVVFE